MPIVQALKKWKQGYFKFKVSFNKVSTKSDVVQCSCHIPTRWFCALSHSGLVTQRLITCNFKSLPTSWAPTLPQKPYLQALLPWHIPEKKNLQCLNWHFRCKHSSQTSHALATFKLYLTFFLTSDLISIILLEISFTSWEWNSLSMFSQALSSISSIIKQKRWQQ